MNNIFQFLESINDGENHEFKKSDPIDAAFNGDPEMMMILKLQKQGLIDFNEGIKNGKPTILSYYITDKGVQYIKDHTGSKFGKAVKKFF